jgi:peptidoglycan/LPS O-acetylase OafA/YrhL
MYIYGLKLNAKYFHNKTSTNFCLNCQYNESLYWSIFIFLLLFINPESILVNIFNLKLLKKFGLYSFGIYLLHFEPFAIVTFLSKKNIMNKTSIEYIITEFFGVYFLGAIFFRLIENPAMNLGNYFIKLANL